MLFQQIFVFILVSYCFVTNKCATIKEYNKEVETTDSILKNENNTRTNIVEESQGSDNQQDEDFFVCGDGKNIPHYLRCDGEKNCPDGSDELNCKHKTCSPNTFTCVDGLCIPLRFKCDGKKDCKDSSDELNCTNNSCANNEFRCGDGRCILLRWKCDGERDCKDGSDELNCKNKTCSPNQFTCKDGRCIPLLWKCDGYADCRDGSDEKQCTKAVSTSCKPTEFHCSGVHGSCIPGSWRCDLDRDCEDGSDELDCTNHTCVGDQFSCGSPGFHCIHSSLVCNGVKDCANGIDEENCTTTTNNTTLLNNSLSEMNETVCRHWMFTCYNKKCIPVWWKCDKVDDCGDNSDEIGCGNSSTSTISPPTAMTPSQNILCQHYEFQCATEACIPCAWVCDGSKDCAGGEDEVQCEGARNCTDQEFKYHTNGSCIDLRDLRKNHPDCPNGSDESATNQNNTRLASPSSIPALKNMTSPKNISTCAINQFTCTSSGSCIPKTWQCDFEDDCGDGSDELSCPRQNCTQYELACENGRCINVRWKCDGDDDCRDGSDEKNCDTPETTCRSDEFKCSNGVCISATWRCDRENDCFDGSDEFNCSNNICEGNLFSCGSPRFLCIYQTWVCDGDKDCANGIDEQNCTLTSDDRLESIDSIPIMNRNTPTCSSFMFLCANTTRCIPHWWKCDEEDDCGNNSDEIDCDYPSTTANSTSPICQPNEFKCHMDDSCIHLKDVCNNRSDCPDESDERNCSTSRQLKSCPVGYFACDAGACHLLEYLCDGEPNCRDGTDEKNCGSSIRGYHAVHMEVDRHSVNQTSFLLTWNVPGSKKDKFEFLPSISKIGTNHFENKTWTENREYRFLDLQPATSYNITIYARKKNTTKNVSASRYLEAHTGHLNVSDID